MSETQDDNRPSRAKRRGDHRAPGAPGAPGAPAEGQTPAEFPGTGGDLPSASAPKEQGGAGAELDPAFATGPMPEGAKHSGAPSSEIGDTVGGIAPFDEEGRRQLVLVKNGHRYVFRYERGEETKVLAGLVEMARDPKSELDWFDAAVLSHQLGQRMSEQLERLRRA